MSSNQDEGHAKNKIIVIIKEPYRIEEQDDMVGHYRLSQDGRDFTGVT